MDSKYVLESVEQIDIKLIVCVTHDMKFIYCTVAVDGPDPAATAAGPPFTCK
jgi:hypothetical protein